MVNPQRDKTMTAYPARRGWVLPSSGKKGIPEKEKVLFPLIHKNGSSSLRRTFKTRAYYCTAEEFNNSEHIKAVILRDPWARFISGVRQVHKSGFNKEAVERMFSQLESRPPEENNTHLVLQSWFLEDRKIDYYLRLETIKKDWKSLRNKIKLDGFPRKMLAVHPGIAKQKEKIEKFFDENEEAKIRALEYLQPDYDLIESLPKPKDRFLWPFTWPF